MTDEEKKVLQANTVWKPPKPAAVCRNERREPADSFRRAQFWKVSIRNAQSLSWKR